MEEIKIPICLFGPMYDVLKTIQLGSLWDYKSEILEWVIGLLRE